MMTLTLSNKLFSVSRTESWDEDSDYSPDKSQFSLPLSLIFSPLTQSRLLLPSVLFPRTLLFTPYVLLK